MKQKDVLVIGFIFIIAFAGFFFSSDFSKNTLRQWIPGVGDGYTLYTGVNSPFLECSGNQCIYDKWEVEKVQNRGGYYGGGSCTGQAGLTGRELDFTAYESVEQYCSALGEIRFKTTKSFKNTHFRTTLVLTHAGPRSSSSELAISMGGIELLRLTAFTPTTADRYGGGSSVVGLFETFPSFLNPSQVDVFFQGDYKKTINISQASDTNLLFVLTSQGAGSYGGVSSNLNLKNTRYQPIVSCQKIEGELLGIETFIGPRQLTYFDTRYPARFCLARPAIVTTPEGDLLTGEIYDQLRRGEVLNIPSGQTYSLLYYFSAREAGLSIDYCPAGQVFDFSRNGCKDISGLITFCSEGEWDSSLHACVVYPEVKAICSEGVLDRTTGKCVVHPPQQVICLGGSTYNPDSGKCELKPGEKVICPTGFNHNPLAAICEQFPLRVICPPSTSYLPKEAKCVDKGGVKYNPADSENEACELVNGLWKDNACEIPLSASFTCKKGFTYSQIEGRDVCTPEVETKYPRFAGFVEWAAENQTFIFLGTIILIVISLTGWWVVRKK